MNEVQLIKSQLAAERIHAADVARACAGALGATAGEFRQTGVDYLVWILTRFEEREQVFHDLMRSRLAADDPQRRAAESALATPGSSREALTKLEAALRAKPASSASAWSEFLELFTGPWARRRDELDRLFAQQAKITDWRAVSAIDADSIFEERNRYARVQAALPAGVELSGQSARG